MVLPNGRFLKIKDVIRNTRDLQKWLQRLAPLHVYYSTSTWLNPVILKPRPKKPGPGFLDSGIILSHDIAFDIDRTPLLRKNIDAARMETLKLLDYMEDKSYKLKYAAFSGSKGFHIVFRDRDREIIPDPYKREMNFIEERTELTDEILEAGIEIDTTVTKDTRRIIRVPGTINTRTGYSCTALTREELEMPIGELLSSIPHLPSSVKIPRFRIPHLPVVERMKTGLQAIQPIFKVRRERVGTAVQKMHRDIGHETGFYYTTFLQSNVLGTKGRHAVILSFRDTSQMKVEGIIKGLIERFHLTDFYLFQHRGRIIALCLTTVQARRFHKIMDFAGVENTGQLMKYEVVSVRIGPLVDVDMKEVEAPMRFIGTIAAPKAINDQKFVSRGHLNFVRKHGIDPYEYPNVHGDAEFKVVDAVLKM